MMVFMTPPSHYLWLANTSVHLRVGFNRGLASRYKVFYVSATSDLLPGRRLLPLIYRSEKFDQQANVCCRVLCSMPPPDPPDIGA